MRFWSLVTIPEVEDALKQGFLVQYSEEPNANRKDPVWANGWTTVTEQSRSTIQARLLIGQYRVEVN